MGRMDDFYDLFSKKIYGEEIVKNLIDKDPKKNIILFKDDNDALNKFIIEYYLNLKKNEKILGCKDCCSIFGKAFKDRPFEFANWRGTLDFNEPNTKEVMIIAEAAGPRIATHLNLSYSLSNLPIKKNGRMDKKEISCHLKKVEEILISENKYDKKEIKSCCLKMNRTVRHKLWEYLYGLFSEDEHIFEKLLNNLYITDMVKCNLGKIPERKSNTIWTECKENCKKYVYEEIKLIKPKLILIMGDSTFDTFISLFKIDFNNVQNDISIDHRKYLIDFPTRTFGNFELESNKIYYYQIYHNSYYYYGLKKQTLRPKYKLQNQKFILEEIIPKVLQWN